MKYTSAIISAFLLQMFCALHGAEPSPSLAQDASKLSSGKGTSFESGVLDLQRKDGSHARHVLLMKFVPLASGVGANPPDARVKLSLSSPTEGVKGVASVSVSIGGGEMDVRLQEKDGVRTMTMTRALKSADRADPKTERIFAKLYSCTFSYELKGDTLILKGFSKEGTKWGNTEFITPDTEITFKAVK